ncbi:MAG: TolC family protein [Deferribacterales bacterium]
MIRKLFKVGMVATAVVAFSATAFAEPFTLQDATKEISRTNPEILESVKVYESVKDELKLAQAGYNPTLSASLSGGREVTQGIDTNDEKVSLTASTATLAARINLFNGFGTTNYVNETKARMVAAAFDVMNTANTVFLATSEAYLSVLQERELLQIASDNVQTQAQILKQIEEKTNSGFGRASDLTSAQARLALSRANYLSQQQNVKQALARFHRQLGRFVKAEDFVIPENSKTMPVTVEGVIEQSIKVYPAIAVADYNVVTKKYTRKRAEALYWPTIDAELKAQRTNNTGGDEGTNDIMSAMLSLNWNLYDGGVRSAQKKKDSSDILKELERSYIERRNLIEAVHLAWNIKEAEENKLPYLEEYVDLTKQTRDYFVEENGLGRRTLIEVLDMENEYQSSRQTLVTTKYSAKTAYFRLLQASGLLLQEYDAELAEKVGLPEKKPVDTIEDYYPLEYNRDKDQVQDKKDQCQQSIQSETAPYGCIGDDGLQIGYKVPEKLDPYFKPNTAEGLTAEPAPKAEEVMTAPATEEAKPAEAAAMVIDPEKKEQTFTFSNVIFAFNSYILTPDGEKLIDEVAAEVGKLEGYQLNIYGHTDSVGSAAYNSKLSKQRVNTVYSRLADKGVSKDIMHGYGKGESMPIAPNNTAEGRKLNRRIEFKLIKNNM